MVNYYFDSDGKYVGCAAATPGTMPPANAVRVAPRCANGQVPYIGPGGCEWVLRDEPDTSAARDAVIECNGSQYYLTANGTYHRTDSCARTAGNWLPLAAIRERRPLAKPCGRCRPEGG